MEPTESETSSPDGIGSDAIDSDSSGRGSTQVSVTRRVPNRTRRAAIGATLGALIIVGIQFIGEVTDHQMANMASYLVGFLTVVYIGYQFHCVARSNGHGLRIPIVAAGTVALGIVCFQFDGFSGELVPQFRLRFGGESHELRELNAEVTALDPALASTTSGSTEGSSVSESTGFLGNDRTGVIPVRSFQVPLKESDLQVLWNQGIGKGWSSFAVAAGRAVTLEQRDDMDCLTCYGLETGELLWMQSHPAIHGHPMGGVGPRSTPTIKDGRVFAQNAEGLVWCVDLLSGEAYWSVDLLELAGWDQAESEAAITWGRAGSPLMVDDLCIVPFGGPTGNALTGRSLVALDVATGDVRWTAGKDQISYASPGLFTLCGQRQIVSVNEMTVSGHSVDDGTVLWEFDWPGQSNGGANCAMAVDAGGDRVLVGKGYGGGSALVKITGNDDGTFTANEEWASTRFLKTKFTHACVDGDTAYAISNGWLEAIGVKGCEKLWTQPRRSRLGQGQIVLVDDVIVAQAEDGELVFVEATPREYRELSRFSALSSTTWNVPTVAGQYLLIRNDRQAICYRLPERK